MSILAFSRYCLVPFLMVGTCLAEPALDCRLAVTDWSIGAKGKLSAFDFAKEANLEGVQVSYTPQDMMQGDMLSLDNPERRQAYLDKAKTTQIEIASVAMGILNSRPFKSDPRAVEWVKGGIAATAALNEKVLLLAFFGKNNLKNDAAGTAETIARLKQVAPLAEEMGITLGLETTLNEAEHRHIIESVDSPAVKVYYDTANSHANGYPIAEEIISLGKDGLIAEMHFKDKKGWLFGKGEVDFPEAIKSLQTIPYSGWVVLEGQSAEGKNLQETAAANAIYLRQEKMTH